MLWSAFYDYLLPNVPGASAALAELHLRRTAIDFCAVSGVYHAEITPVDIVAGTADYTLVSPDAQAEPAFAWTLWYDTQPLDPATLRSLDASAYKWSAQNGDPRKFVQKTPTVVTLYPNPGTAKVGGLTGRIALKPTFTATGIADWVGQRYLDTLVAGATARLLALPQKPWTDPNMALANMRIYNAGRSDAFIDAQRSLGNAPVQVMMRST